MSPIIFCLDHTAGLLTFPGAARCAAEHVSELAAVTEAEELVRVSSPLGEDEDLPGERLELRRRADAAKDLFVYPRFAWCRWIEC
jgi:hypothetical protein